MTIDAVNRARVWAILAALVLFLSFPCTAETLGEMAERPPSVEAGGIAALVREYDAAIEHCVSPNHCALPQVYFKKLRDLRRLPPWDQLRGVDAWVNNIPYHDAAHASGTVAEFLKQGGTCKEYVLTKLVMLRDLGFGLQNLLPASVKEPGGGFHQILLVKVEGAWVVLSNYTPKGRPRPTLLAISPFHDYPARWIVRLPGPDEKVISSTDDVLRCG